MDELVAELVAKQRREVSTYRKTPWRELKVRWILGGIHSGLSLDNYRPLSFDGDLRTGSLPQSSDASHLIQVGTFLMSVFRNRERIRSNLVASAADSVSGPGDSASTTGQGPDG